jgi:uncharacterized protein YdhG (YjbR/CyaY superfamily)
MTQKQSKDDITYICNILTKIEYQTTNAKVRFDNDDYVDIKALSETIVAQLEIMMQYYPSYQARMNIRKLINGVYEYE